MSFHDESTDGNPLSFYPRLTCSSASSSPSPTLLHHQLFRYRLGEELLRFHTHHSTLSSSIEDFNTTVISALWVDSGEDERDDNDDEKNESLTEEFVDYKSSAGASKVKNESNSSSTSTYYLSNRDNYYPIKKKRILQQRLRSQKPPYCHFCQIGCFTRETH